MASTNTGGIRVELRGITKRFGPLTANQSVNLELRRGEVHALLGENGAGKTTLMNVLGGVLAPDEGQIIIEGEDVLLRSPKHAFQRGIGTVHQHARLVEALTAAENLFIGWDEGPQVYSSRSELERRATELAEKLHLEVDMRASVWQLSVAEKQRLEILRTLTRGAEVLILDEPTAVLTPGETQGLFQLVRELRESGGTIVFISHKLPEVMAIADRITVLRQGRVVRSLDAADANVDMIAELMVGEAVQYAPREARTAGELRLEARGLTVADDRGLPAVRNVDLDLHAGEIVGVAGVTGNGQRELSEALAGMRKVSAGTITVARQELTGASPRRFVAAGVGFVPEDRLGTGLAASETIWRNSIMRRYDLPPVRRGPMMSRRAARAMSRDLVASVRLSADDIETPVRALSGGHAQRLLTGRELAVGTHVLLLAFPTRGLDVAAVALLRSTIIEARDRGAAVLLISEELDEIIEMSDRVIVMYEGSIAAEFTGEVDRAALGRAMGGSTSEVAS